MGKKYNERIKDIREDHDITQAELAKILEISDVTLQSYEYGKSEPRIKTLIKIAKYFNTSIDYIAGITNERKPYPRA